MNNDGLIDLPLMLLNDAFVLSKIISLFTGDSICQIIIKTGREAGNTLNTLYLQNWLTIEQIMKLQISLKDMIH